MTDRELLELAAKAACLGDCWFDEFHDGYVVYYADIDCNCSWNPLEDDGDAFRLAVKLELTISYCTDIVYHHVKAIKYSNDRDCEPLVSCEEKISDDPYAATRRAIVRAAASIGEQMK